MNTLGGIWSRPVLLALSPRSRSGYFLTMCSQNLSCHCVSFFLLPTISLALSLPSAVKGTKERCICGVFSSICTTADMIVSRVLVFPNKVQRLGEIGLDFTLFLAFEELRAGRHQRLHHPHTVRPRAAARFCNLLFCLCPVLAFRRNQVKIQVDCGMCPHRDYWRIFPWCARCAPQYWKSPALCTWQSGEWQTAALLIYLSLRFCHTRSYPSTSASSMTSL